MKMQLVQRQYDNLATMPCIVRVAIAMIPIGLFSVGCAIMYALCSELVEQGQSLRLLAARHPKNDKVWYNTARMAKGR